MNLSSSFDDEGSSFTSTDVSDDFSVDDALEQLGEGVGGLRLSEVVGRGAFGSVYKVFWKGKPAALKVGLTGQQLFLPIAYNCCLLTCTALQSRAGRCLVFAPMPQAQSVCTCRTTCAKKVLRGCAACR